jgi:hypothetical protein
MKNTFTKGAMALAIVAGVSFSGSALAVGQHELGVIGQKTDVDFPNPAFFLDGDVNEYGVFYNYGNMYQERSGYVFRFNADWTTGSSGGVDSDAYDIGITGGYRMELSPEVYFDLLAGTGYSNWELDGGDASLKIDKMYVRYGAALQADVNRDNTIRLELGSKYNVGGDIKLDVDAIGSDTQNLKNRNNFYAEASWVNSGTGIPLRFSVFHENMDSRIDHNMPVADLDAYQTGFKVSAMF